MVTTPWGGWEVTTHKTPRLDGLKTQKLNKPKTLQPQNSMTPKLNNPKIQQPHNQTTLKPDDPKTQRLQNLRTPKFNPEKQGPKGGSSDFYDFFRWATAQFTGIAQTHDLNSDIEIRFYCISRFCVDITTVVCSMRLFSLAVLIFTTKRIDTRTDTQTGVIKNPFLTLNTHFLNENKYRIHDFGRSP